MKYFKKFLDIFSYFIFFAFIGYIWEIFYRLLKMNVFVNRGLMHGPWLPLYGYGGLIVIIISKKIKKEPLRIFLVTSLLCTILEYFASWILEVTLNIRWWNYRNYFLNINGRVCLGGFLFFGLLGLLAIYVILPRVVKFKERFSNKIFYIIVSIIMIIFFIDLGYSLYKPNTGKGITFSNRTISDKEYNSSRKDILKKIDLILEENGIDDYSNNNYYLEFKDNDDLELLFTVYKEEKLSDDQYLLIEIIIQDLSLCKVEYTNHDEFISNFNDKKCISN